MIKNVFKNIAIFFIWCYQKTIAKIVPHKCAYLPSCSNYTIIAIKRFGVLKGSLLGLKRICRCNSSHMGEVDNVPQNIKGDFKWLL